MSTAIRRGAWVVPTLVLALMFTAVGAAHASCAEPLPLPQALDQAQTVFVGTVTGVDYGDRVATFRVDDLWKGNAGGTAVVNGGPALADLEAARTQGSDVATSVDRIYVLGEQYLVVSYGMDGNALADNACSATQPFTPELDEFRPASPPATPGGALDGWAWAGLAGLALALGGAIVVASRRMRLTPTAS